MFMKKRTIYRMALAGAGLAILIFTSVFLASADPESWTDHADISWYDSTYTTFTIDSAAKLAGVAKLVNEDAGGTINGFSGKSLEVSGNLDLSAYSWVPIGTTAKPFHGSLIGKDGVIRQLSGLKLSGNMSYAGFIGYMDGATVGGFELMANGSSISVTSVSQNVYAGAAVGRMVNGGTIFDIINHVPVTVTAANAAGYASGVLGTGTGTVANSVNHASVEASGDDIYAGGIAGNSEGAGLVIKKVTNNGAIHSSGSTNGHIGGIAGGSAASIDMDEENSVIANTGAISVTGGQNGYAGGLLGQAEAVVSFSANSTNTGTVSIDSASASATYAGGLVGAITSGQMTPMYNFSFANTVAVTNHGGTNSYTGGLVGYVNGDFPWGQSFTNSGTVTASGADHIYSGGFVGYIAGELKLIGSVKNMALIDISGGGLSSKPDNAYTGGLVGYAVKRVQLESTADHAYENSGDIKVNGGNGLYTGGIASNRAYARSSGAASLNVYSTGKLNVTGLTDLYTGGFIGIVPAEGADKVLTNAAFANDIMVAAAASNASHTVSTGGIVGYFVQGSGSASITNAAFTGTISAAGNGAAAYTGGITGYMDGGTIEAAHIGNTAEHYAAITADGSLGGVAGYAKGTVNSAAVAFITLTMKKTDSFAGGIAGKAQGAISGSTVGEAAYENSDSMRIQASIDNAAGGVDRAVAGGIVGQNDGTLAISGSTVSKVGLITVSGRSDYKLGAVAGILTVEATVGSAGMPIEAKQLVIDINAGDSFIGGAVGVNYSPQVYLKAEDIAIHVNGDRNKTGAIAGTYDVLSPIGTGDPANPFALTAENITITAQGAAAYSGGLFGENKQHIPSSKADNISITSSGSANRIGGMAGVNTGTLADSEADNVVIASSGIGAEAGGITGRSEGASIAAAAVLSNLLVHSGEDAIVTSTGADAFIGGVVGHAIAAEILNSRVEAEDSIYAILSVKAVNANAGGLAGRIEQGKIVGDSLKINVENLLISTSANTANAYIGGIAGYHDQTRTEQIVAKNVSLVINGQTTTVGGLAGYNRSTPAAIISKNYIAGLSLKVNAVASNAVAGGIVGVNDRQTDDPNPHPETASSTIQNSRAVGSIQVSGPMIQVSAPSSVTGGIVGENRSLIANISITDKVSVASKGSSSKLGGLIGVNKSTGILFYAYSNANLTIEGEGTSAGGLVGDNKGRVVSSYTDIDILGKAYGTSNQAVFLGGLVGSNSGLIEKSYTLSKVTSNGRYSIVGGLVGEHSAGAVTNSYSANEVIASQPDSYAGGFLGRITLGTVANSYSAGQVTAVTGSAAGGFAGRYDNISKELLYKTYYVKDEANQINIDLSDFAEGNHRWLDVPIRLSTLLAAKLKDRTTFPASSGWDFTTKWKYGSLNALYKYPELQRNANSGGEGGSGNDVNANINWYIRDPDASHYELKTEAELAGLAAIVNGTVPGVPKFNFADKLISLLNPIHIQSNQWVSIGNTADHAFQGTFDGGGYLIDGLSILPNQVYTGLFGVIGQQATARNLVLEPLSISGSEFTGTLAGRNEGIVSDIEVRLLNGAKISGGTVGGIIGTNIGTLEAISMKLDDGRIEAAGSGAIVGGFIGDNHSPLVPGILTITSIDSSMGSSFSNAIVGGLVGQQAGDLSNLQYEINAGFLASTTGANNILGGLIGRYVSGNASNIRLAFTDGKLEASGSGSTLGGLIGRSEADNRINNVTVTGSQDGIQLIGNGIVGGIVGDKEGKGSNMFDLTNVRTEKVLLSTSEQSAHSILGGIAGKLTHTALHHAEFAATLHAAGNQVFAGGIVGEGVDSILFQVEALPDIASYSSAGESSIGGAAGSMSSTNVDRGFDFGKRAPFYYGIYEADVHTKELKIQGADNIPDLFVGGIVGKNMESSIYSSVTSSNIAVHGGKTAVVGGLAGFNNGIIVQSTVHSNIQADTSIVYMVGGIVGKALGGEIHYTNIAAHQEQAITIGSAASKAAEIPATYAGGFIGIGDKTDITHSFADIPIIVTDINPDNLIYAGGFAGLLGDADVGDAQLVQVYAKGELKVEGKAGAYVGGFVGAIDHYSIIDAYASGKIANTGFDMRSGGFASTVERSAKIKNASAIQLNLTTTGVNQAFRSYSGGFAGYNDGLLENVFAKATNIAVQAAGANVYTGALVGYNYSEGKISLASYMADITAVGRDIGSAVSLTKQDLSGTFTFGSWDVEDNVVFLDDDIAAVIEINNKQQLYGAAHLYNDADLSYYRLFNRTAAAKPIMDKLVLRVDLDLSGRPWVPISEFRAELDGAGKQISGLKLATAGPGPNGFVGDNYGTIANVIFNAADITAGASTGIVAGVNHVGASITGTIINGVLTGSDYIGGAAGVNEGTIANVEVKALTLTGGSHLGGAAGVNRGMLESINVNSAIAATGTWVGGIAGSNEGQIAKTNFGGSIIITAPGRTAAAGGIAGENSLTGAISESFSYSDIRVQSDQAIAGGIAGLSSGEIANSYNAGRIKAEGTDQAKAGGIVGYAADGSIGSTLNYGEVIANIDGRLQHHKTFWGGIVGHKEAAAVLFNNAFNKQMLKVNIAYYNDSGDRVTGDAIEAKGMKGKELASGNLPDGLDTGVWKAAQGFYPELGAFYGTSVSKLSAAAVVLSENELVNLINSSFQLTKSSGLVWTGESGKVSISTNSAATKGSMLTTGSAFVTASLQGISRNIVLNTPALKYNDIAVKPRIVSGEMTFADEVSIVLATDEAGGKIYYTLDGSKPSQSSNLYTGAIVLRNTAIVQAITAVDEKEDSQALYGVWMLNAPAGGGPSAGGGPVVIGPVIVPEPPVVEEPPVVQAPPISAHIGQGEMNVDAEAPIVVARNSKLVLTALEGHKIFYTTDGSTPTEKSLVYDGEILITGTMTIKAIIDNNSQVITIHYEAENAKYKVKSEANQVKYMSDYGNGEFKPDADITRYELIKVLSPLLDMQDVSVGSLLSDVKSDLSDLVAFFGSAGIIEGYPDGTFGGDRGLTRAEFVVIMSKLLKLNIVDTGKSSLSDVKGHWSEKYVNAFTQAGYLKGFPDGTFKPDGELSRAQAVVIINRIIGRQKQNLPAKYSDLPPTHWAYEDIMPVVN